MGGRRVDGVLRHLAHRVADLPVLLAVATRDAPAAAGMTRLTGTPGACVLHPGPLSAAATGQLARAHGVEASANRVAAWHELTGGNPLLLTELIAAGRAGRASARLEGWVAAQLDGLGAPAAALAQACSVLDDGAPLPMAARLAGLDVDAGLAAADELLAASLLVELAPVRFRHPLVRAAVAASLPPGRTAALHRLAARLLSADAAPPGAVAHHLLSLPPLGDADVACGLLAATREAAEHADPAAVRRYVARALAEPPPANVRAQLLALDGRAAIHLGASGQAVEVLTAALAATAEPAARAGVLRSLVSALLASGRMADAADLVDAELAALAQVDRALALAAEAEILSASRHTLAARLWNADRLRQWRGRLTGASAGERLLLANLCTQVALDGGAASEAVDLALLAAADGLLVAEQTADALAVYQVVWVLCGAERRAPARTLLDAATADAAARGSAVGFVLTSLFRSYVDLADDDLAGAEAHTGAALDAVAALPDPLFHEPAVLAAAIDVHRER
ncbi:MAG: hypothetical protein L0H84_12465, partial [Pseudonocardia sp.]|nr:hypothetical protein [Pseudonocardia sp.]